MALSHVWKNPRHQARQRQSVVTAGVRASRVCKSVAAIRISGDFKPSPVRMAKRRFTIEITFKYFSYIRFFLQIQFNVITELLR